MSKPYVSKNVDVNYYFNFAKERMDKGDLYMQGENPMLISACVCYSDACWLLGDALFVAGLCE